MKLDARQAHYILQALVERRKVAARHIKEILRDREREIAALRRRLEALEAGGVRAVADRVAPSAGRAQRRLSRKVRALRKLQGEYMGLVRRLKPSEKNRVRNVREKKGLAAAIRAARAMRRS